MNASCRNGRRQPGSQVQRRQLAKKSSTSLARRQGSARQSRLYVDETPARTWLRRRAVVTRELAPLPRISDSRCSAREVVPLVVVVGKSAVRRVSDASDRGISESRVPAPHDRFAHRVAAWWASASAMLRWRRSGALGASARDRFRPNSAVCPSPGSATSATIAFLESDRPDGREPAMPLPRERSRAPVGPDDRLRVRGAVSDGRTRNYSTPGTLLVLCITERKARGRPPCFAPGTATQGADHLPDVAWPPAVLLSSGGRDG